MAEEAASGVTQPYEGARARTLLESARSLRLTVVEGPEAGRTWESTSHECSVGSHPSNDLFLSDPTVSRFHCELRIDSTGASIRDLDSRNGTIVDGVYVVEAFLRSGSLMQLGRVVVRFDMGTELRRIPISNRIRFGSLAGRSIATRACFALMERAARSAGTVLIEGETGTGKTQAARSIHEESSCRDRPFVIVDCGVVHDGLIESELFGHEKGAFSGATERRTGAFEEAGGGTVFLDEIGELPLSLQPKLLRAIDEGRIRRLGSNTWMKVDVRVIAATHRNLRAEVNAGRFREDLFYRVAVLRIALPPLRQRPDDIPAVVDEILLRLGAPAETAAQLRDPAFIRRLQAAAWPGNVRELSNYIQRYLVFQEAVPPSGAAAPDVPFRVDVTVPYREAARRAREQFERAYVRALLEAHDDNVTHAAQAAEIDRVSLHRLKQRHGIR